MSVKLWWDEKFIYVLSYVVTFYLNEIPINNVCIQFSAVRWGFYSYLFLLIHLLDARCAQKHHDFTDTDIDANLKLFHILNLPHSPSLSLPHRLLIKGEEKIH